jgi:TolB-like protein/tetratricopeptide (TPR) repeat protein
MPDDPRQATVFLSYAHEDQAQAQRLAGVLERRGFTVWWDALIEGGSRYATTIDEALEAADAVLVLWSARSIQSDWVRDEAAQGRDRHRLVPLSLDATLPPLGFRQIQAIDLSRWRGRVDSREIDGIVRAICTAAGQEPVPRTGKDGPPLSRRQAIAGGAVGAVALAGGGALVAWRSGALGGGDVGARSIAVLPFKNLSDAGQSYLSDGLTEEIRGALARNAGLMVLAGTSSNSVRDMAGDAKAIADRLGVSYLLEGSVERQGDMVRVGTNLTNGRTGFSEWSQRVERKLGDIFAFESEVARTVSNALSVRMATDAPATGGTRNVRAYEAYLQGKALYNLAKDEATDRQAKAAYEIAIAADPNFALAHAALSRSLASLAAAYATANELKGIYAHAIDEAKRATAIAPTLAEGHLALGYALFTGRLDVKGARPSYDKAYRYGHGNADIILLYASYTARTGRFREARDAINRALALDPLNPRTHRAAGTIAFASRRYGDAIAQSRRALELNPRISNANATIGDGLMQLGKLAEARAAYLKEPSAMFRLRGLAALEHRAGNRPAAERAFSELVATVGDAAMYQQAEVMAQWGRRDEAIAKLERAREIGDSGLSMIAHRPVAGSGFARSEIHALHQGLGLRMSGTVRARRFVRLYALHPLGEQS